jgi:hypothetical protein
MHRKTTSQLAVVPHPHENEKRHRSDEMTPNGGHSPSETEPRWVRPQRASKMYDIGLTKIFALIKDGRLEPRKSMVCGSSRWRASKSWGPSRDR